MANTRTPIMNCDYSSLVDTLLISTEPQKPLRWNDKKVTVTPCEKEFEKVSSNSINSLTGVED